MADSWATYPSYPGNPQNTANDLPGRLDIANAADYNVHDREILAHQVLLISHDSNVTLLLSRVNQAVLTTSTPTFASAIFTSSAPIVPSGYPTEPEQVANKAYVDSRIELYNTLSEVLGNGNSAGSHTINMNSNRITSVGDPSASGDVANKGYVDSYYVPYTGATSSVNIGSYSLTAGTVSAGTLAVTSAFTFPTTDGSDNQVLVTNGAGILTWEDQSGGGGGDPLKIENAAANTSVVVSDTESNNDITMTIDSVIVASGNVSGWDVYKPVDMNSQKITSLGDPTDSKDAVNKEYADSLAIGLSWIDAVTSFVDFTTAEPSSPDDGDRYINTVTGTSSETSQSVTENYIYEWNGSSWTETAASDKMSVKVIDEGKFYTYNSADGEWKDIGSAVSHQALLNLQGGDTNQYYHATEAEHDNWYIKNIDDSDDVTEASGHLFYTDLRVRSAVQSNAFDATIQGDWTFSSAVSQGAVPSLGSHLTTKTYVDALIEGFSWREPVISKSDSNPPTSPDIGDRYIVAGTASDWYNASWLYRQKITIDCTKVDEDLTDFPTLIKITGANEVFSKALSTGNDILFTSDDCTTKIPHEIEYYSGSGTELYAWVKITLSSSVDTEIYMYYGNAASGNQQQPTDVWDSNYYLVQHLNETSGTCEDSTTYGNDGTANAGVTQGSTGEIKYGALFNGSTGYIELPASSSLTGDNLQTCTISAWVKFSDTSRGYHFAIKRSAAHSTLISLVGNYNSTGDLGVLTRWYDNTNHSAITNAGGYNDGTYHYLVATINGLTRSIYIDGAPITSDSRGMQSVTGNTAYACLGSFQYGSYPFNGSIDEARFSRSVRSAGWISTEYNNQSDPSTFFSVGSEETPAASGAWADHVDDITEWDGINWAFEEPETGWTLVVTDESVQYNWNGSSWVSVGTLAEHNTLSGLQGGAAGEYYHLTSDGYLELTQWMDDVTLSDGGSMDISSGTFTTTGTITSGAITSSAFVRGTQIIATGTGTHPSVANGYVELYMLNTTGRIFAYTGSAYRDLAIGDWNGGDPNIMLKVGGDVGIGVGAPSERLHVDGNIKTNNGIILTDDITVTASGTSAIGTTALAFGDAHIDQVYLKSDPTDPKQATTKEYVDTNYQDIMLEDKEYYVDPTGSDITGDGSVGSPFRTIQHCIDITPKSMHGHSLTILINDGTYNESVEIDGFVGGYIDIYSSSYDPEAVTIVQQAGTYAAILAGHNSSTINIYYVSLLVTQNFGSGIYVYESNVTYISTCLVGKSGAPSSTTGVTISDTTYFIDSIYDVSGGNLVDAGVYLPSGIGIIDYDTIEAGLSYVDIFAPVPLDYTGFIRTPEDAPSVDYHVANKKYVDDLVAASGAERFLTLDQTSAQTVHSGQPAFASGVKLGNGSSDTQEVFRILDGSGEESEPVFQWRPDYETSGYGGFSFYSPGATNDVALPCIGNADVAIVAFTTSPDHDSQVVLYDNSTGDIDDSRLWVLNKAGSSTNENKNAFGLSFIDHSLGFTLPALSITTYGKKEWQTVLSGAYEDIEAADTHVTAVFKYGVGQWTDVYRNTIVFSNAAGPNYLMDLRRSGYKKFSISEWGDVAASGSILAHENLYIRASGVFQDISVTSMDASGSIDMNGYPITSVMDPVHDQDAATKAYVDAQVATENLWDRSVTTLSPHTAGDVIEVAADTDKTSVLGRAKIGYDGTNSDYAAFAHYDNMSSTKYAFRQYSNGYTYINAQTGCDIVFTKNGTSVGSVRDAWFEFNLPTYININSSGALRVYRSGVHENVLRVDASAGRVGINCIPSSPYSLEVWGDILASGNMTIVENLTAGAGLTVESPVASGDYTEFGSTVISGTSYPTITGSASDSSNVLLTNSSLVVGNGIIFYNDYGFKTLNIDTDSVLIFGGNMGVSSTESATYDGYYPGMRISYGSGLSGTVGDTGQLVFRSKHSSGILGAAYISSTIDNMIGSKHTTDFYTETSISMYDESNAYPNGVKVLTCTVASGVYIPELHLGAAGVVPVASGTIDIGETNARFGEAYIDTINAYTVNANTITGFAYQPFNLVYNHSFESWEDGTDEAPTMWIATSDGGTVTVARDATYHKMGNYSCSVTSDGTNNAAIRQVFFDSSMVGIEISAGAWVYCTTASRVSLVLFDLDGDSNIASTLSTTHGGTGWEYLTVSHTISGDAVLAGVQGYVSSGSAVTFYIDAVTTVIGDQSLSSCPANPILKRIYKPITDAMPVDPGEGNSLVTIIPTYLDGESNVFHSYALTPSDAGQSYYIIYSMQIPDNFTQWAATDAIKVLINGDASADDNAIVLIVADSTGTPIYQADPQYVSEDLQYLSISANDISAGTFNAGERVTLVIVVGSIAGSVATTFVGGAIFTYMGL